MGAIEDAKHAVAVDGGVADLHPRLRFFLVKFCFTVSTPCTHRHVHWATRVDSAIDNIPRSKVSVDVSRKNNVDAMPSEKRFQMQFGSVDLWIMPMDSKCVIYFERKTDELC
jgi:hypothetical protein